MAMVIFFGFCVLGVVGCNLYFMTCLVTEELYPMARNGLVRIRALLKRVRLRMPVVLVAS
jgi:hypothetical protein